MQSCSVAPAALSQASPQRAQEPWRNCTTLVTMGTIYPNINDQRVKWTIWIDVVWSFESMIKHFQLRSRTHVIWFSSYMIETEHQNTSKKAKLSLKARHKETASSWCQAADALFWPPGRRSWLPWTPSSCVSQVATRHFFPPLQQALTGTNRQDTKNVGPWCWWCGYSFTLAGVPAARCGSPMSSTWWKRTSLASDYQRTEQNWHCKNVQGQENCIPERQPSQPRFLDPVISCGS